MKSKKTPIAAVAPEIRPGQSVDLLKELRASSMSEEARKALFGQTAQSVRAGEHKLV